jgi:hypothetical protein
LAGKILVVEALTAAGATTIYREKISGARAQQRAPAPENKKEAEPVLFSRCQIGAHRGRSRTVAGTPRWRRCGDTRNGPSSGGAKAAFRRMPTGGGHPVARTKLRRPHSFPANRK